jgi:hypothetical protein
MLLVAADVTRVEIGQQLFAQDGQDVSEIRLLDQVAFGRQRGLLQLQPVVRRGFERLWGLPFLEAVVTLFELSPAAVLCAPGNILRVCLC